MGDRKALTPPPTDQRKPPAPPGGMRFVDLVASMRAAQQAYFKTRSREVLITSKQLEAEVDRMITALRSRRVG
jgi:hypothetical protein